MEIEGFSVLVEVLEFLIVALVVVRISAEVGISKVLVMVVASRVELVVAVGRRVVVV